MASISFDSELMTQQVAAVAIPNSKDFVAVHDENGRIMIFSVGTDGVFYLTKEDRYGSRIIINLSKALNIVGVKIAAYDVTQNIKTSTLYIVAATASGLLILKPFKPSDIYLADNNLNLTPLIISGGPKVTTVQEIYMSKGFVGDTYPEMVIAYVPLDQVHRSTDIARLQVTHSVGGDTWALETDLKLPENATSVVDLCAGVLPVGSGYFAIYTIQGQLQLIFTNFDTQYPFQVSLQCPPGAKCLATVFGADGTTALLVGGQGLYYWTATDAQKKNQPGTVLSHDQNFQGTVELYVTQTISQMSIFAANMNQGLGYAVANVVDPIRNIRTTPLLPDGKGGRFSALLSQDGTILQLVVTNSYGVLTMLQQNIKDGIWNAIPLFTPSLSSNHDFQAYTVHIDLLDASFTPLADQTVLLTSARWSEIVVNGRSVSVGPAGLPVVSDGAGTVTLLIPTEDISASAFSISSVYGSSVLAGSVPIDPTFKVNQKLKTINTGDDLRKAKLQSGGSLLNGLDVASGDVDEAAKAIAQLHSRITPSRTMSPDTFVAIDESHLQIRPERVRRGAELGKLIAGHRTHRIIESNAIKDMLWSAWNWLVTQTTRFTSWAIEKIGATMNFIVEIAGQVMSWAVNTAVEIGKVMTWVFTEVLKIGKRIIDWLGFLLNWGDIQKTQRSIVAITNSGLQAGSDNLNIVAQKVDRFFVDLENNIKSAMHPDVLLQKVADPSSTQDYTVTTQSKSLNSTQANYANYQFTHGGASSASSIPGSQSSDPLSQAWTNIVEPAINSLKHSVTTIGQDLVLLFSRQQNSIGTKQVLQKLGVDILLGIIDAIRSVIVGLVKMGAQILSDFKGYINLNINIPIFSALYKQFISGGTNLTLLDGLAFIIAIPVTILTKLVTDRSPIDLTSVNYNDLVNGKITDPARLSNINGFMSAMALTSNGLHGLSQALDMLPFGASTSKESPTVNHSGEKSRIEQQSAKFRNTHPLKILLEQQSNFSGHDAEGKKVTQILTDWRLLLGVVAKAATIPTDSDLPGYPIRWISWLLGCSSTFINAAIRSIEAGGATAAARKKALGATDGVIALINYALICTINGLEFKTDNFPGKDNAFTTFQVLGSTFDVISSEGSAVANIASDPETILVAETVSYASMAFSYTLTGTVVLVKLGQGKYNYILVKI